MSLSLPPTALLSTNNLPEDSPRLPQPAKSESSSFIADVQSMFSPTIWLTTQLLRSIMYVGSWIIGTVVGFVLTFLWLGFLAYCAYVRFQPEFCVTFTAQVYPEPDIWCGHIEAGMGMNSLRVAVPCAMIRDMQSSVR
jgi:hypothetical protein